MAAEEGTKRIARDLEIYQKRSNDGAIEDAGGDTNNKNIQRGTKDIMTMIQAGIQEGASEEDIEDIEDIEPTEE